MQVNYNFKRAEDWRWTPSAVLFKERLLITADYEYSFPNDEVTEDLIVDDVQYLQELPALPIAKYNVEHLEKALQVSIPINYNSEEAISLKIEASADSEQLSRVNFDVQADAKIIIETYANQNAAQFGVFNFKIAAGVTAEIVFFQDGEIESVHSAYIHINQAEKTNVFTNVIQMEIGDLCRVDVRTEMDGEHSEFNLGGVQSLFGKQAADIHVDVQHKVPNCKSNQSIRGVIHNEAFGLFDGKIHIHQDAQKIDSQQNSRYQLMDANAKSQAIPRLEIYADDVQCAHGSTTGGIDEESLFYLRSRGLGLDEAKRLLLKTFILEGVVGKELEDFVIDSVSSIWDSQHEK